MMVRDEQFINSETVPGAPAGVSADTNIYITPAAPRPAPPIQTIPEISPIVGPILTAPIAQGTGTPGATSPIPSNGNPTATAYGSPTATHYGAGQYPIPSNGNPTSATATTYGSAPAGSNYGRGQGSIPSNGNPTSTTTTAYGQPPAGVTYTAGQNPQPTTSTTTYNQPPAGMTYVVGPNPQPAPQPATAYNQPPAGMTYVVGPNPQPNIAYGAAPADSTNRSPRPRAPSSRVDSPIPEQNSGRARTVSYSDPEEQTTSSTRSSSTTSNNTNTQRDAQDAAYEAERLTRKTTTKQTTTRTQDTDGPKTKKKTGVNWGGIVKGAAIVTAVVVVGVASFYGVSTLTNMAFASPTLGPILTSVQTGVMSAVGVVGDGIAYLTGYIPEAFTAAKVFVTGLFDLNTVAHVGSVASASTGAATAAITLAPGTVSKTMGLVAAGGAVAYTASHGLENMNNTALVNHHTVTVMPSAQTEVTTTVTTDPGTVVNAHHVTGKASTDLVAQTEILNEAAHGGGHDASHAAHHAAELGFQAHEAAHDHNGGHDTNQHADAPDGGSVDSNDVSAPDVDLDEGAMDKIATRNQRSNWSSRTGSRSGFMNALKSGGGYTAAVSANRGDEPRIKAPTSDYATDVEERKAAMGEASIA